MKTLKAQSVDDILAGLLFAAGCTGLMALGDQLFSLGIKISWISFVVLAIGFGSFRLFQSSQDRRKAAFK